MTYLTQIEWIRSLQESVNPSLTYFLTACNNLDTFVFYSVVILVVWMGFDRKSGIELLYLTFISSVCNLILKQFYDLPRPLQMDPSIALVTVKGGGFPSGGAQMAFLLSAYLYDKIRGNLALILALVYLFLASFVRIFIGAHFITDVLMGWFVGGSLFILYRLCHTHVHKWFKKKKPFYRMSVICLIALWTLSFFAKEEIIRLCIATIAFTIGLYLDTLYNKKLLAPKTVLESVLRILATLIQFIVVLIGMWALVKFFHYPKSLSILTAFIFLGIWIPYMATKINLKIGSVTSFL